MWAPARIVGLTRSTTTFQTRALRCFSSKLPESFSAWRVSEQSDGSYAGAETTINMNELLVNNKREGVEMVTIRVTHSSLNYKDALSAAGNKGVTRKYPHTPGIDAAGYIVSDKEQDTSKGPKHVLVTGYDLGMNTDGGFGEYISVPKDWVVDLPTGCNWSESPRLPMIYGTAGLTAGLLVHRLLQRGDAVSGQTVAVTGATGAVGSVAVELLARLGFHVVAVTGKLETKSMDLLTELGASEIVGREVLEATSKPLLKPRFHHAIDTVGGSPLVSLLKQLQPDGSVACCGLAAGPQLPDATVLPFILRGVQLLGVDSVEIPKARKTTIWHKLAHEWACPVTEKNARDIGRHQLNESLKAFLKGQSTGKIVLDHSLTEK